MIKYKNTAVAGSVRDLTREQAILVLRSGQMVSVQHKHAGVYVVPHGRHRLTVEFLLGHEVIAEVRPAWALQAAEALVGDFQGSVDRLTSLLADLMGWGFVSDISLTAEGEVLVTSWKLGNEEFVVRFDADTKEISAKRMGGELPFADVLAMHEDLRSALTGMGLVHELQDAWGQKPLRENLPAVVGDAFGETFEVGPLGAEDEI
jgi:hypothetical protein